MQKKWQVFPKISNDFIKKFPEISPVILQLLFNRNLINQKLIDEFLYPDYSQDLHDPFLFSDMKKAINRIKQALENNEKIVIHGDYDADGVCATVVLYSTLKKLGAKNLDIYLPHREKEGYGLNQKTIEYFKKNEINLIITCDCAISNYYEIQKANEFGIETIITDHHHEPEKLPAALAIINPILKREKYPFKQLAGVGVAFKLAQALLNKFKIEDNLTFEKWLLDLVAIGTIADISPLIGENRTLVKYGLIVLAKTKRLGLQKLFELANINIEKLNTHTIAFQIAPRINSAGRVDHANSAFKLLSTINLEEAIIIASELNKNNQERQKITEQITGEAKTIIQPEISKEKIFFAAKEGWNIGVIGLVAGKICQEYHRPVFIFSINNDIYTGSGRSIPELNLIEAVESQASLLERFGGHSGACGLTIKEDKYRQFYQNIRKMTEEKLKGLELLPTLNIDLEIDINDLVWKIAEELEKFEPFGDINPRPKFLTKNLIVNETNFVGKDKQHLKIKVNDENGLSKKVIIFNCEEVCPNLQINDKIDLVYELITNEWNGNKELELNAIDLKKSL